MAPFERLADESFAYLTTTGRRTGKRHTIEIWFGLDAGTVYVLSGGSAADWVRNIRKTPSVRVRIGSQSVDARARELSDPDEDRRARELLDSKYQGWKPGRRLSSWARHALPIAIDL